MGKVKGIIANKVKGLIENIVAGVNRLLSFAYCLGYYCRYHKGYYQRVSF